jgi:hypothetical protein
LNQPLALANPLQGVSTALLAELRQTVWIGLVAPTAALLTANPTWVDGAPVEFLYWNPGMRVLVLL